MEFLSSPKKMGNCIPLHLFVDIWEQKLSSCYVSLIAWLTTISVKILEKKSEISIYYKPVHFSTTTEVIFMKQYSFHHGDHLHAFPKKCTVEESISFTIFFLWLCCYVHKQSFVGGPESMCYYMMRKAFENFSREVHFFT